MPRAAAGCGHLRASDADREQVMEVLKVAFAPGPAGSPRMTSSRGSARRSARGRTRNWLTSPPPNRSPAGAQEA